MRERKEVILRGSTILLITLLMLPLVLAATTGPKNPGTFADVTGIGTESWKNVERVEESNNSRAKVKLNQGINTSHYLQATNYGFSIPVNAVIQGVTVDVERKVSSIDNGIVTNDVAVRLVKGGVIQSTDRATSTAYTTSDTYEAHGGTSDLWGSTWTPVQINAAGFGTAIAVQASNLNGEVIARIDHINITVTYNTPPDITLLSPNGGEVWNGTRAITWTASDPDGDPLTIIIQVQTGINWTTITSGEPNTGSYSWDTSTVPDNASYKVRVFAADGTLTWPDDSDNAFIIDNNPPNITVLGNNPAAVEAGTSYTDAGATADDLVNGDLTNVITVTGSANPAVIGNYTITYTVNDSIGYIASATRTVTVADTLAPVITLAGSTPIYLEQGESYSDAGANALDSFTGNLTSSIVVDNPVNTSIPATYYVTYSITDSSGNNAMLARTVVVGSPPPSGENEEKFYGAGLGPIEYSAFADRYGQHAQLNPAASYFRGSEPRSEATEPSTTPRDSSDAQSSDDTPSKNPGGSSTPTENIITGAAALERNPVPVTKRSFNKDWLWLILIALLAAGLYGGARYQRHRSKPEHHHRQTFLKNWKL